MCSDESVSAKGAIDLCVNQMKCILNSEQLPKNASVEIIGRAYHATETLVEVLTLAYFLVLVGFPLFSSIDVFVHLLAYILCG